ncbi:MAG: hypothetical protein U9R74_11885, partial [Pseudomonadota bacterium]|nr:hypothetical protein [Pseudomonadota bacterium]
ETGKLRANLGKSVAKLGNVGFIERAPAAVVEKERTRAAEMQSALEQLEAQAARIRKL